MNEINSSKQLIFHNKSIIQSYYKEYVSNIHMKKLENLFNKISQSFPLLHPVFAALKEELSLVLVNNFVVDDSSSFEKLSINFLHLSSLVCSSTFEPLGSDSLVYNLINCLNKTIEHVSYFSCLKKVVKTTEPLIDNKR